jgi:alcohol dehydrogenase (cytochrome c)
MRWYFQFTPHDPYDYDSVQVPVLANANWNGSPRKLMLWGNRNGFFYVLDRGTGKFLNGKPFVKVNWASGLDANGRPMATPQPPGSPTYPGIQGGTNWYSPSYSPSTGLFYLSTWDDYGTIFTGVKAEYKEGTRFTGGANTSPIPGAENPVGARQGPVNTYTEAMAHGGVVAIDPATGDKKWKFEMHDVNTSGILTTATDLLFVGGREGYFQALDARTGALLWKQNLGGEIIAGPMSYQVDGKQYITIASGNSLFTFALRE